MNTSFSDFSFYIATFGCKVSQYESQALREYWTGLGGVEVDSPEQANVSLIASCAVTAAAVSDARQMAHKLARTAPETRIIITGCAASAAPDDFTLPAVVCVLPQREKHHLLNVHPLDPHIADLLAALLVEEEKNYASVENASVFPSRSGSVLPSSTDLSRKARSQDEEAEHTFAPSEHFPCDDQKQGDERSSLRVASPNRMKQRAFPPFRIHAFRRARPVLKVQDGCSHRCSYCIVPLTRGPACSRHPSEAVDEARRLLQAGHREIMISGVNLRQYRHEGLSFWAFLRFLERELAEDWAGIARFRLSSLEPAQLNTEGLETLEASRLLCPHVHLSLQSGSSAVLKRMGRDHYTPDDAEKAVEGLRRFWPIFGLGADILMGFPGETQKEAEETLHMVERLPFTYAHVFPWSARPGTPAASMPNALPKKIRQEHAAQVRAVIANKHSDFLRQQAALASFQVVLDGEGAVSGINEYYAPCQLEGQGLELHNCRPIRVENGKVLCTL